MELWLLGYLSKFRQTGSYRLHQIEVITQFSRAIGQNAKLLNILMAGAKAGMYVSSSYLF